MPDEPAQTPPGDDSPARGGPCQGKTRRGKPCHNRAEPGRSHCVLHDPDRASERQAMLSSRGKRGRSKQLTRAREARASAARALSLATTADIRAALERALTALWASATKPLDRANATARLCSAALNILRVVDLEAEVNALQAQLTALEQRLGAAAPAKPASPAPMSSPAADED